MARKDRFGIVLRTGEYERPNNKGYQYVYKDAAGKRATISASTLDELREKEKTVTIKTLQGVQSPAQLTINDMYRRWIQVKRGLKPNTRSNYMYMYEHFVLPSFGQRKLKAIKRSDIRAFYNSLVDDGMQINSLETIQNILHQVFDVAIADEYIIGNPTDNALKELKREHHPKKKRALTRDEQKRFISFLEDNPTFGHWFAIFYMMLATGLRVGEITGLRWSDIDTKRKTITVDHTLTYYKDNVLGKQVYRINTTKTAAGFRVLPTSATVLYALHHQTMRNPNRVCKTTIDGYTDFVFTNRFGEVFNQNALNRALRDRIIPAANAEAERKGLTILPPFSCHTLRHTFCTNLCEAGVDIKTIQTLMGHSDISTTMDIYAEATRKMKTTAAITIDQYFTQLDKEMELEGKMKP